MGKHKTKDGLDVNIGDVLFKYESPDLTARKVGDLSEEGNYGKAEDGTEMSFQSYCSSLTNAASHRINMLEKRTIRYQAEIKRLKKLV